MALTALTQAVNTSIFFATCDTSENIEIVSYVKQGGEMLQTKITRDSCSNDKKMSTTCDTVQHLNNGSYDTKSNKYSSSAK